eukprot:m.182024 g.182024  ORF g.182024 m.182024 type:complete len:1280 (+) comp16639_c1_seq2:61-3900(+)
METAQTFLLSVASGAVYRVLQGNHNRADAPGSKGDTDGKHWSSRSGAGTPSFLQGKQLTDCIDDPRAHASGVFREHTSRLLTATIQDNQLNITLSFPKNDVEEALTAVLNIDKHLEHNSSQERCPDGFVENGIEHIYNSISERLRTLAGDAFDITFRFGREILTYEELRERFPATDSLEQLNIRDRDQMLRILRDTIRSTLRDLRSPDYEIEDPLLPSLRKWSCDGENLTLTLESICDVQELEERLKKSKSSNILHELIQKQLTKSFEELTAWTKAPIRAHERTSLLGSSPEYEGEPVIPDTDPRRFRELSEDLTRILARLQDSAGKLSHFSRLAISVDAEHDISRYFPLSAQVLKDCLERNISMIAASTTSIREAAHFLRQRIRLSDEQLNEADKRLTAIRSEILQREQIHSSLGRPRTKAQFNSQMALLYSAEAEQVPQIASLKRARQLSQEQQMMHVEQLERLPRLEAQHRETLTRLCAVAPGTSITKNSPMGQSVIACMTELHMFFKDLFRKAVHEMEGLQHKQQVVFHALAASLPRYDLLITACCKGLMKRVSDTRDMILQSTLTQQEALKHKSEAALQEMLAALDRESKTKEQQKQARKRQRHHNKSASHQDLAHSREQDDADALLAAATPNSVPMNTINHHQQHSVVSRQQQQSQQQQQQKTIGKGESLQQQQAEKKGSNSESLEAHLGSAELIQDTSSDATHLALVEGLVHVSVAVPDNEEDDPSVWQFQKSSRKQKSKIPADSVKQRQQGDTPASRRKGQQRPRRGSAAAANGSISSSASNSSGSTKNSDDPKRKNSNHLNKSKKLQQNDVSASRSQAGQVGSKTETAHDENDSAANNRRNRRRKGRKGPKENADSTEPTANSGSTDKSNTQQLVLADNDGEAPTLSMSPSMEEHTALDASTPPPNTATASLSFTSTTSGHVQLNPSSDKEDAPTESCTAVPVAAKATVTLPPETTCKPSADGTGTPQSLLMKQRPVLFRGVQVASSMTDIAFGFDEIDPAEPAQVSDAVIAEQVAPVVESTSISISNDNQNANVPAVPEDVGDNAPTSAPNQASAEDGLTATNLSSEQNTAPLEMTSSSRTISGEVAEEDSTERTAQEQDTDKSVDSQKDDKDQPSPSLEVKSPQLRVVAPYHPTQMPSDFPPPAIPYSAAVPSRPPRQNHHGLPPHDMPSMPPQPFAYPPFQPQLNGQPFMFMPPMEMLETPFHQPPVMPPFAAPNGMFPPFDFYPQMATNFPPPPPYMAFPPGPMYPAGPSRPFPNFKGYSSFHNRK